MKTLKQVLIFVFLMGMILGVGQPALLYASESPQDIWNYWVDTSPFTGTKLAGPLSIYFDYLDQYCTDGSQLTNMYATVRLSKGFDLNTFQGKQQICIGDITGQGNWIVDTFLNNAVKSIYPTATRARWRLKSIDNAQFHDQPGSRSFVADIQIAVAVK